MRELYFRGHPYTFEELIELRRSEGLEAELTPEAWQLRYDACQKATATLRKTLEDVAPDVLVIVGNDHLEFFDGDLPALAVYWGDGVDSVPMLVEDAPPSIRPALWARQADSRETYVCHPDLGRHIIEQLVQQGFDVAEIRRQDPARSIGHAFTHVRRRLMPEEQIPIVPVLLNSYYPPNQPTASRCYSIGRALKATIQSWPADARVGLLASGGLSHFVVDPQFDMSILEALAADDEAWLRTITNDHLQQGTAETRHWITTAAALADLRMDLVDYIPGYRTSAGTGCGLAFARWV